MFERLPNSYIRVPASISTSQFLFTAGLASLSLVVGFILAYDIELAAYLCLIFIIAITLCVRWQIIAWILLSGLMLFSYGFNNIPLGPVSLPAVDVLAIPLIAISLADKQTRNFLRPSLALPLIALSSIGAARLIFDLADYGTLALRDASYIAHAWMLPVGYCLAKSTSNPHRRLDTLLTLAVVWYILYPFRDIIIRFSPKLGIQSSVSIVDFVSATWVPALAVLWFIYKSSTKAQLLAAGAVLILVMAQSRTTYIALPLGILVAQIAWPSRKHLPATRQQSGRVSFSYFRHSPWIRLVKVTTIASLFLLLAPPLSGRMGQPTPQFIAAHVSTLTGAEGPGATTIDTRIDWWKSTLTTTTASASNLLVGTGFGPDLIEGFHLSEGRLVRKPHNDYLEVWARTGIIGLIVWLIPAGVVFRRTVRAARQKNEFARQLIGFQVVMLTFAMTQPFFGFAYGAMVYYLISGYSLALLTIPKDGPP